MLKKALIFTILSLFLTSCVTGPDRYMKRSANNKIFDRKGFQGGKRAPLYNKRYIAQAKKNILNGEYDDYDIDEDDIDETRNISRENIEMYKEMIEQDLNHNKKGKKRSRSRRHQQDKAYPSIVNANNAIDPNTHANNLELREELEQIKTMLNEAKKDLASFKCPKTQEIETQTTKATKQAKPKPIPKREPLIEESSGSSPSSTIIEPVKSI